MDYVNKKGDLVRMLTNEAAEPRPLAFSLLVHITNGFSAEKIIGTGGSAKVYKV